MSQFIANLWACCPWPKQGAGTVHWDSLLGRCKGKRATTGQRRRVRRHCKSPVWGCSQERSKPGTGRPPLGSSSAAQRSFLYAEIRKQPSPQLLPAQLCSGGSGQHSRPSAPCHGGLFNPPRERGEDQVVLPEAGWPCQRLNARSCALLILQLLTGVGAELSPAMTPGSSWPMGRFVTSTVSSWHCSWH